MPSINSATPVNVIKLCSAIKLSLAILLDLEIPGDIVLQNPTQPHTDFICSTFLAGHQFPKQCTKSKFFNLVVSEQKTKLNPSANMPFEGLLSQSSGKW